VSVGDVFKEGRYVVLAKLGWGHFSTVWLASDTQAGCAHVALKVQKSASHYTEAAYDEIEILRQVEHGDPDHSRCVVRLLDSFEHVGPHGTHVCMVFERLGDNLLTLIKHYNYRGVPLPVVKAITRQVLTGLDYLHRELHIIHTDLKPENVLLRHHLPPRPGRRSSAAAVAATQLPPPPPRVQLTRQQPASSGPPPPLTKNQKKKLKRRAKKATHGGGTTPGGEASAGCDPDDDDDEAPEEGSGEEVDDATTTTDSTSADGRYADAREELRAVAGSRPGPSGELNLETRCDEAAPGERGGSGGGGEEEGPAWSCKIVDLGNSCWTYKQFSSDIQTRQYRCPEVLLGAKYSTPADMWSLACLVFELATGDLLFDPRSGDGYERDEDHLALMIELLGRMPRRVALGGKHSREFFTRQGELRHIRKLRMWPLSAVLQEKYKYSPQEAAALADFLVPMLNCVPEARATAAQCLQHPWLTGGTHTHMAQALPPAAADDEGSSDADEERRGDQEADTSTSR
jgi:serine/threonine-protein kinase SRPK3